MSTPKFKMVNLPASLTKLNLGHFLDETSLSTLSRTCTHYRDLFKGTRSDREQAARLLFCILNPHEANLKRMQEILSLPKKEAQSIVLIRVSSHEVYFSEARYERVSKRKWTNVSPLEAAALCGDVHLVKRLLEKIPVNQRSDAIEQLLGVKKKCTTDEAGSYICGLVELRQAYKEYNETYESLISTRNLSEIDKRWDRVSAAHKNLSWFLLQVFCNPIPHYPIPDFTKEPPRICRLSNGSELNLDLFHDFSCCALYKGASSTGAASVTDKYPRSGRASWCWGAAQFDFKAFNHLYEVLPAELDKVIKMLMEPSESTDDLDSDKSLSHSVKKRKI